MNYKGYEGMKFESIIRNSKNYSNIELLLEVLKGI